MTRAELESIAKAFDALLLEAFERGRAASRTPSAKSSRGSSASQWRCAQLYARGVEVTHRGTRYRATAAHFGWQPGEPGAGHVWVRAE